MLQLDDFCNPGVGLPYPEHEVRIPDPRHESEFYEDEDEEELDRDRYTAAEIEDLQARDYWIAEESFRIEEGGEEE